MRGRKYKQTCILGCRATNLLSSLHSPGVDACTERDVVLDLRIHILVLHVNGLFQHEGTPGRIRCSHLSQTRPGSHQCSVKSIQVMLSVMQRMGKGTQARIEYSIWLP